MKPASVMWGLIYVGTVYTDLSYGDGAANKFDLYVPADSSRENYGLVVYLHPGGFTSGDKSGDAQIAPMALRQGLCGSGVAGLFSVMAGKSIMADLFGTGAYLGLVKDISAAMWIDENSVPCARAYGAWDRVQAFGASRKLDQALTKYNVPHEYIVCEHSGHGLQNDNAQYAKYMDKISEYLNTYMPVE